jgi:hypothetical protein
MIEFDQPVSFIDLPESVEIDNDFGTYNFSLKPMSESKLLINSYFLTKTRMVKKEDIYQVANIYNAIEKNTEVKLRFDIQ